MTLLKMHYKKFSSTLNNRDEFGNIFPFVLLTTVLVISIVKSSLALSLGLVGALSIVRFSSKDRLWELIDWCENNGIRVANPHTHFLDEDTRWYGDEHLARKLEWDPYALLNPGHLLVMEHQTAPAGP